MLSEIIKFPWIPIISGDKHWLVARLVGWSDGRMVGRSVGQSVGWLVGVNNQERLATCLGVWLRVSPGAQTSPHRYRKNLSPPARDKTMGMDIRRIHATHMLEGNAGNKVWHLNNSSQVTGRAQGELRCRQCATRLAEIAA